MNFTVVMNKVKRLVETSLPTQHGEFRMIAYGEGEEQQPALAFVKGADGLGERVLVRIHSECLTGDTFASVRCDCGEQLDFAMDKVAQEGGVVLYLRQEGRGIGLLNKMHAYNLQDQGMDTAQANVHLGFGEDQRDYAIVHDMLKDLGVKSVRLMTNNPLKINALNEVGIEVVERVPVIVTPREENKRYLDTKRDSMGHMLD